MAKPFARGKSMGSRPCPRVRRAITRPAALYKPGAQHHNVTAIGGKVIAALSQRNEEIADGDLADDGSGDMGMHPFSLQHADGGTKITAQLNQIGATPFDRIADVCNAHKRPRPSG